MTYGAEEGFPEPGAIAGRNGMALDQAVDDFVGEDLPSLPLGKGSNAELPWSESHLNEPASSPQCAEHNVFKGICCADGDEAAIALPAKLGEARGVAFAVFVVEREQVSGRGD